MHELVHLSPHLVPCLALSATGSGGVLTFGLLALTILSFLIGLAGLAAAIRLRASDFPAVSRARIRWRIGVFWGSVATNLLFVPLVGLVGIGTFVAQRPDDVMQTGLLTLMLIGLIAANYVGLSVQRALTRIKLQPASAMEKLRRHRSRYAQIIRGVRENMISAVTILGISILIWYLIDNQLSSDHQVTVTVTVDLTSDAREHWTIAEIEPAALQLIFRGPKELVEEVRNEEIEAHVRLRPDDLGGAPTRRTLEKDLSAIEFQSRSDRRWPSGVQVYPLDPRHQQVRITVAPNVSQEIELQPMWLHEALEGYASSSETNFTITTFDPRRVHVVYPEQPGRTLERLYFEPIDVQAIARSSPRAGEHTVTLGVRAPDWVDSETMQVFRSSERRALVERIRVEIEVADQSSERKSFRDVPVRFALPSRCTDIGVKVASQSHWDLVRLEGPRRALERVHEGDLVLVWWPDESTIDLDELTAIGIRDAHGVLKPVRRDGSSIPDVRLVSPHEGLAVTLVLEQEDSGH